MKSVTEELLAYLNENRATLRAAMDSVPQGLRETRPEPDRWSTAEVIEHLGIVEHRVAARLRTALAAMRANATERNPAAAEHTFDRQFAERVPNRSRRVVASEASQPTGKLTAAEAWSHLEASRAAVIKLVKEGEPFAASQEPIAPHPSFGPLTFHQWVVFIGGHDARHAAQIREIAEQFAMKRQ